jgi:hypothetical protein
MIDWNNNNNNNNIPSKNIIARILYTVKKKSSYIVDMDKKFTNQFYLLILFEDFKIFK